jgi:hypothetical protein
MRISDNPAADAIVPARANGYLRALLCAAFIGLFAMYLLGVGVRVHWGNTAIPLREVLATFQWDRALATGLRDWHFLVFVVGGGAAALYSIARSPHLRLGAMLFGFVVSVAVVGEGSVAAMLFGPVILIGYLGAGGASDGEFYVEGMPQVASLGVWMLLCLLFTLREFRIIFSAAETGKSAAISASI